MIIADDITKCMAVSVTVDMKSGLVFTEAVAAAVRVCACNGVDVEFGFNTHTYCVKYAALMQCVRGKMS